MRCIYTLIYKFTKFENGGVFNVFFLYIVFRARVENGVFSRPKPGHRLSHQNSQKYENNNDTSQLLFELSYQLETLFLHFSIQP